MSANHLDTITITIALDAAPLVGVDFGTTLFLDDEANGTTLDGDRFRLYQNLAGVQTDNTAGFVSAGALAAATAMFSQSPAPSQIMIGRRDSVGAETYVDAIGLILAAGGTFYAMAIDSRADADILAVSANVEALDPRHLFFAQSADADWLTSGFPAALTAIEGRERTIIGYHDTAAEHYDAAFPANRLAFDPDLISVPWRLFALAGVAAYATAPNDTQKSFLRENDANPGLPYATAVFAPDKGTNANGRPIEEMLTRDWFEARLRERTAAMILSLSNTGQKVEVSITGAGQVKNQLDAQGQEAISAKHFVAGGWTSQIINPTDADRAAQRLRLTGQGINSVSLRLVDYNLVFTRNP